MKALTSSSSPPNANTEELASPGAASDLPRDKQEESSPNADEQLTSADPDDGAPMKPAPQQEKLG